MTDKFIAVANKQEADRAAKYLESLGYSAYKWDSYSDDIHLLYTKDGQYRYSDYTVCEYIENWKDEQLFVPADFEPMQEHKEEYVLSGVWQFLSPTDNTWHVGMNTNRHRQNTEDAGYQTRDLYFKA